MTEVFHSESPVPGTGPYNASQITVGTHFGLLITVHIFINFINRFYLALTALILAAITLLSLWPVGELPSVPGTDKSHHLIAYAMLMLPTAIKQHKHCWLIAVFFVCYSGAIELIQPHVNRYGEWLDLAANTVGLLCGILLARFILLFTKSKQG